MVPSVPLQSGVDPKAFMLQAEQITDPSTLEQYLDYSVSRLGSIWPLVHAYLLWRLNRYEALRNLLLSLPSDFHANSQYWLLLGLAQNDLPASFSTVERCYRRALKLSPDRADLNYNLANILRHSDSSYALALYKISLTIDSYQPQCWHNYGSLLLEFHRFHDALLAFKTSLFLDPYNVSVLCDLGLLLFDLHFHVSAEKAFLLAISLDPSFSTNHINLGSLFLSKAKDLDALRSFHNALKLEPSSSSALFNLGLCHLTLGHFASGWIYYEERLRTEIVPSSVFPSTGPLITSLNVFQDYGDKTILVWSEQGLGDTIQFSRYLLFFHSMGISFRFFCQKELFTLFSKWFISPLNLSILPPNSQHTSLPHIPLLSLPRLFNTQEFSIPSSIPYFSSCAELPSHLQVPKPPGGLSVGICWASNPENKKMYSKKSIPLRLIMPLFCDLLELDLIDLHSLQVGSDTLQLSPWSSQSRVTDWSHKLLDFSDTATVIQQLDFVISVDTATAHLSASLGCPTWILLPFDADFRWMRNRTDSPWYPGIVRLFRQTSYNDWSTIVQPLRTALNQLFHVDCQALASSQFK